jgi:cytochrome c oxidase assembly factor CtaG
LLWATVAWLWRRRRSGVAGSAPELRRYSAASAMCGGALLASGLFLGPILAEPAQLFTTGYGMLLVGKAVGMAGLIPAVMWQRRRCSARFAGSERGTWWLLAGEGAWLSLAFGASVGLAQQPAASFLVRTASENQLLIGYELPEPPTWGTLSGLWRFDLVLGSTAILLAVAYLLGVVRLRRRGIRWPPGRTLAWLGGCALLLIATSSGISTYAEALFSLHMVVHMLLNMSVPVLLVLGGPITLALAALPEADRDGTAGPREWLVWSTSTRFSRWLGHPLVAIAVYVVSLYGLYFTPVFTALVPYHWGHQIMNIYFLLIGYFFYASIIGIDPGPRRLPYLARIGALLAVMPFHVFFGVIIFDAHTVLGGSFYDQLTLPWMQNLLTDQRAGAVIAWIAGEIPLLLVAIALSVQWARQDAATGGPGNAGAREQVAYDELLSALSRSRE